MNFETNILYETLPMFIILTTVFGISSIVGFLFYFWKNVWKLEKKVNIFFKNEVFQYNMNFFSNKKVMLHYVVSQLFLLTIPILTMIIMFLLTIVLSINFNNVNFNEVSILVYVWISSVAGMYLLVIIFGIFILFTKTISDEEMKINFKKFRIEWIEVNGDNRIFYNEGEASLKTLLYGFKNIRRKIPKRLSRYKKHSKTFDYNVIYFFERYLYFAKQHIKSLNNQLVFTSNNPNSYQGSYLKFIVIHNFISELQQIDPLIYIKKESNEIDLNDLNNNIVTENN